ncbi:MAG: signal peptide peptidase SppA [Halobacteriaceae archaeon]
MATDSVPKRIGRAVLTLLVGAVFVVAGWLLFVYVPDGDLAVLLGVLLVVGVAIVGMRIGRNAATSLVPDFNVAEVGVEGAITRDAGGGAVPTGPVGADADDIVEQIEDADDSAAEALLLKLDTPGGEVVPSDDIRLAVEAFDGPVVAYATDLCASGGYWIAAGCDHVVAREGCLVGSIGVIGSRINAADLADKLGLSYERIAAGEYKDAGTPLKELEAAEREYLQGIVDGYYEDFVERVAEGRDIDPETVRDTEARVFLGPEARDLNLVDEVGTRDDALDEVEARIEEAASVEAFEPERPLSARLGRTAAAVAAGVAAGASRGLDGERFRFR